MKRFILKRIASMIVTLWLLSTVVFLIVNVLPGNVARKVLGGQALEEDVQRLNQRLGTDKPMLEQYWLSLKRVFTLHLGDSYKTQSSVTDMIIPALGRSAKLAILAFIIAIPLSIAAGIYAARRQDKLVDRVIVTAGLSTSAIPEFVTATILSVVFAVNWKLGKVFANPPSGTSLIGQLEYLWLPATAMAITYFGYIARMTRAGVIGALHADFTRTAVMKGLTQKQVMRRHVLRNAMAPTIVVISTSIGYLFGGIIGVEKVFNYPGLGSTMLTSVERHDLPVLQGAVLIVGMIYMISTLLADLLIAYLNPRVRLETSK